MTDTNTENDHVEASAAPLIEHLAELRTRLIYSVSAFIIAMLAVFVVSEPLLKFLAEPISKILLERGQEERLIFTAPQEKFFVMFRISMIGGLMVAFPVIAFQLWRFVAPGLYKNEKGAFLPFIIASPLLFLLGAAFAHFVVTPLAMRFFIGFGDILPSITSLLTNGEVGEVEDPAGSEELKTYFLGTIRESLDLALKFIFAFGLCFQLPVLLTLLGMAGIVSAQGLRDTRKYAVVGILVLAAVVTPPDVITQVILFTAVYMLYEISIWLVQAVEKKAEARLRAEGYYDDELDGEE
jgi:sec-independent protein translocase protein TatC